MPFWPDSGWGVAFVSLLFLSSVYAISTPRPQYRIAAILWAGWFLTRTIDYMQHDATYLWALLDVAFILAFILEGSSAALLCAAFFVVPLNVDMIGLFTEIKFNAAASVFEGAGYLSMAFMTGAAYDDKGRGSRLSGYLGRRTFRWSHRLHSLQARAPAPPPRRLTR
jgi:hypothetical protein